MPASVDNASQNPAPFVDQRPNGPGVSKIDPSNPAAPMYRLLAKMRSPVTLRDLMITRSAPAISARSSQSQRRTCRRAPLSSTPRSACPRSRFIRRLAASAARFSVRRRRSRGAARPMMLYLHGGGFTVGQSEDTAYITSRIAAENAMVVVSANYRLAPESSAGGNLAAALVIKARDEGVSPPQATVLLAPITDFFFEQHESFERLAPLGIVYDTAFIGYIRGAYLVHGKNWAHPHASPARADLGNYPPTFIATGTADPLVDDNRAFAQKLRAAGVGKVEHFVREGMPHGFYFFPGMFKQGDEAFAAIAAFLKQAGAA